MSKPEVGLSTAKLTENARGSDVTGGSPGGWSANGVETPRPHGDGAEIVTIDIDEEEIRALLGERKRDGAADAVRRPGHHRSSATNSLHPAAT